MMKRPVSRAIALGQRRTGLPPPVQIDPQQQRVVVEHLLEVRHPPEPVDAVAGEAAGQLVVHAAPRHRLARPGDEVEGLLRPRTRGVAQQELQHHRRRELRAVAESAGLGVVLLGQCLDRRVELLGAERAADRVDARPQVLEHVLADRQHLVASLAPRIRQRLQDLGERRAALSRLGREVRTREERLALRRQHTGHRPAALTGHRLRRAHVDRVDVGALLAVDLDVDEVLVHVRRGDLVLERLVRHHVAPVAGGVADAQQDRPIKPLGLGERLVAPLPPVDRVVGVLLEVGTRGLRQTIRHAVSLGAPRCLAWPGGA